MAWEAQGQTPSNKQAKIKSATSAGPSSISANATVKDHDGTVLHKGTNGWTCYPDMPDKEGQNPMCLDPEWVDWYEAFHNQRKPRRHSDWLWLHVGARIARQQYGPVRRGPDAGQRVDRDSSAAFDDHSTGPGSVQGVADESGQRGTLGHVAGHTVRAYHGAYSRAA